MKKGKGKGKRGKRISLSADGQEVLRNADGTGVVQVFKRKGVDEDEPPAEKSRRVGTSIREDADHEEVEKIAAANAVGGGGAGGAVSSPAQRPPFADQQTQPVSASSPRTGEPLELQRSERGRGGLSSASSSSSSNKRPHCASAQGPRLQDQQPTAHQDQTQSESFAVARHYDEAARKYGKARKKKNKTDNEHFNFNNWTKTALACAAFDYVVMRKHFADAFVPDDVLKLVSHPAVSEPPNDPNMKTVERQNNISVRALPIAVEEFRTVKDAFYQRDEIWILDVACGRGGDLYKWQKTAEFFAKTHFVSSRRATSSTSSQHELNNKLKVRYVGFDLSSASIEEARHRWARHQSNSSDHCEVEVDFRAQFHVACFTDPECVRKLRDSIEITGMAQKWFPSDADIYEHPTKYKEANAFVEGCCRTTGTADEDHAAPADPVFRPKFDIVSCQFALHYAFSCAESRESFRQVVNAFSCGAHSIFVGTTMDSEVMRKHATTAFFHDPAGPVMASRGSQTWREESRRCHAKNYNRGASEEQEAVTVLPGYLSERISAANEITVFENPLVSVKIRPPPETGSATGPQKRLVDSAEEWLDWLEQGRLDAETHHDAARASAPLGLAYEVGMKGALDGCREFVVGEHQLQQALAWSSCLESDDNDSSAGGTSSSACLLPGNKKADYGRAKLGPSWAGFDPKDVAAIQLGSTHSQHMLSNLVQEYRALAADGQEQDEHLLQLQLDPETPGERAFMDLLCPIPQKIHECALSRHPTLDGKRRVVNFFFQQRMHASNLLELGERFAAEGATLTETDSNKADDVETSSLKAALGFRLHPSTVQRILDLATDTKMFGGTAVRTQTGGYMLKEMQQNSEDICRLYLAVVRTNGFKPSASRWIP